ncbi:hypothetical protein [Candidatus Poriferisocius sp.]|uniref:hypothetical protein n=1 Tax=Candidatus Poriferisocius sp. TaxID=3101276 RepID=UPI003B0212CD
MYPHLPLSIAIEAAEERIRRMHRNGTRVLGNLVDDIKDRIGWTGSGTHIDTDPFERARERIELLAGLTSDSDGVPNISDQDKVEGEAAAHLFEAVIKSQAEPAALDDPGFWRYVALAHVWNFAAWRESKNFTAVIEDGGTITIPRKLGLYVNGKRQSECVPTRMFLRVRCLGGMPHAHLAGAVREGTDFWRSHILRVVAGEHPPLVRAMVRCQADEATRLSTGPLREFAKQLNRTLVNVVPAMLDDKTADALVDELWCLQLTQPQST